MAVEQTLILIKPDGLVKSLTGNVISRLAEAKLTIMGAKVVRVSRELAEKHYEHLKDKPFFEELIQYIMGEVHKTYRVLALVYQGENAIAKIRDIVGDTDPEKANPVSIRGAYGRVTRAGVFENVVHASSSPEDAEKEIKLWFMPDEIVEDLYPVKEITLNELKRIVWA
ncbi:MAG TPA: nucleoside-diphosphate kinase [Smithellaceae bacterium]|jgi:nucleoside-diphosphate kinase|nr:nucleoside-diphosphate kinase [Syntrophaceae bacterium]MDX9815520.1 nucleoside-diphosphate kinase [Smithellaceae bacterium]NMD06021.1 nucleoside-diphosphate kinase [Deltaproteobacteria bacterium]MBP8609686.1 nucleoside-diphosphate kinase [Syntrophaceae bacterium]HNV65218.1 nucleoside-diphosphate kinase [Smithellaceae bacterium]